MNDSKREILNQVRAGTMTAEEGAARLDALADPAELPAAPATAAPRLGRSEEHTSELQSQSNLVCRLLLEKKKTRRPRQARSSTPLLRVHLDPIRSLPGTAACPLRSHRSHAARRAATQMRTLLFWLPHAAF